MQIYVLNHKGKPLMPCSPRTARLLLKENRAKVVKRTPFTIRWTVPTRSYTQPITLGVDSGYIHVGLSAVSERKELCTADVALRTDIVKLNSERRTYRRSRRNRKTWYRQPRFLNRKKPDGWLAPSIQHKLDSHIKAIDRIKGILPVTDIVVEVAAFDIQKIKNPDIEGVQYQQGDQAGFWNVREYVLYRDGHRCRHCKGKSKDPVLNVHHIVSRQIGGDRPDNLITLCETCHKKHHAGELKLKVKASNGFKAETFMSMVRWQLINQLRERGESVRHTYGHITKSRRIALGLPKSHISDAFVIAGGNGQTRAAEYLSVKQVRKCNRKLFRGTRSHIKNTASRYVLGFQRFDRVLWKGQECFVFGRRTTGYFDLRKLDGTKVHSSASAQKCQLLESARTFLVERRGAVSSPA
ncbi:MAG: RNA-guided endonuclease IscB [Desulfobacca sp.]|nr:RNA-guided endonuclease IscB [Desulfobacca sp.]